MAKKKTRPDGWPGTFCMPFGKHQGEMLDNIEISYLVFIRDNMNLYGNTKEAVEAYLKKNRQNVQAYYRRSQRTWMDR